MSTIPEVKPFKAPKLPTVAERTLPNGLRAMAIRKTGVPLFELRLITPVARARSTGDGARERMLSETLLSGTATRSSVEIAGEVQDLGGSLGCNLDADELVMSGSGLATNLRPFLALVADVLTGATYPDEEVNLHRDRIQQEIAIVSGQPGLIAETAYRRRLYGTHAYANVLPAPESVGKVTPAALRKLHEERILPRGSALIVVGDIRPEKVLDDIENAFGAWSDDGEAGRLPKPKKLAPGPIQLVDRPGSVQTTIRIGGFAIPRSHPDYPALALTNTILGGYFSSRLIANLREDKGYTYGAGSSIAQQLSASHVTVQTDVAVDVTAAALLEARYELARICTTLVKDDELVAARRYMQGTMAIATQTQAGLASYLLAVTSFGLGIEYLRDLPAALEQVTAERIREIATKYLAPSKLVTVLVGDSEAMRASVEALDEVEPVTL